MPPGDSPTSTSKPRVRLIPRRGPLHFGLLLASSGITLFLPFLYGTFLFGLALFWGWSAHFWARKMTMAMAWSWQDLLPLAGLAAGLVTWVLMVRPLLKRPRSTRSALQITPASQPAFFELADELCWHLGLEPVEEIWLDTTAGVRASVKGGLGGISTGRVILHVGLPVVSVTSSRELAALMVRELAMNSGGMSTTFCHLLRELNAWFYRALHEQDPWEMNLRQVRDRQSFLRKCLRASVRGWSLLAKLPFACFFLAARLVSALALLRLRSGAAAGARKLVGRNALTALEAKMRLLDQAWAACCTEIRHSVMQQRLPDNLSLLMARHVARAAREVDAAPAAAGAQEQATFGESIIGHLPREAPAASLLVSFVDLSRQVTFFYYQHELGINLQECRLVTEEEVVPQNRREDESLLVIRRYFGGLAHPERAMCGLGATHAVSPGRQQLQDEILKVREEVKEWGGRLKTALREWNMAWQRRRDLEAAATLSLAGYSVSRVQFGDEDNCCPQSLRAEASRQKLAMEEMESALLAHEVRLESRFAAALGLLWWSAPEELDDVLRARRQDLPHWCALYESMAAALPAFRELLTTYFAFQTLEGRAAGMSDSGQVFTALQSIVPRMTNLVRQILGMLDGAVHPFTPNRRFVPLGEHLLQGRLPEPVNISMNPGAAVDMRALSAEMTATSSEVIAPFVDRFLRLYHQGFAWLAESAERTENHYLSPANLGADIELLMPEEFARREETGPLQQAPQARR
jgi:hypothetical protein